MADRNRSPPPRPIWAYGYEIALPLAPGRLRPIEMLLEEEQAQADSSARTWAGRFVVEERVTHILVVSDSPDQSLEINRRLEEKLEKMQVDFSVSPPVAVESMIRCRARPPPADLP